MTQYSKSQLANFFCNFCKIIHLIPHLFFSNVSEVIPDIQPHYPTCSPSRPHQPNNDNSKRRSSFNYLYPNRNRSRLTCVNPSNPSTPPCSSIPYNPKTRAANDEHAKNFFMIVCKVRLLPNGTQHSAVGSWRRYAGKNFLFLPLDWQDVCFRWNNAVGCVCLGMRKNCWCRWSRCQGSVSKNAFLT